MTNEVKILGGIIVMSILIVVGAVFFLSKGSNSPTAETVDTTRLVQSDSFKVGSDSAKVKVVEFADFECPACQQAAPIVEQLEKEYEGKSVQFIFRHFPLPQHRNALSAANAAEAIGSKGKFWEVYKKLYDNQRQWGEADNPMSFFETYAQDLGIDPAIVKEAVEKQTYKNKIERDQADGASLGVNSTPTFFVGSKKIVGIPLNNELKVEIEAQLAK